MPRNKQALRRTAQATADGYENFIARVGMQTPNQHSASTYRANFTSRNRMLVEWSYRSSWIIGEAVDAIPDDMTRKGIRITSEIDAKDRGILESQLDELQIWDALNDVLKWSRLYGGAVGFIMIEGQAPMTPLRPETIGKGKFKGILPLDRWMIDPVLTRRIKDMGPDLGKPEFYDVVTTATGIPAWRIHHSRLIRFDGVTLPFQQKMTENEWGMSVVERIWDRLTAFDSATVGAAQLVYKAHLRTYSVEKLRELIALGGPAYEALLKNIDLIRQFQSNEGMTLMDSRDKFETHQYSFSGLDDILSQFAEQISGAVGIPLVRLFGQSPKGFSTGDADLANYYDRISSLQERRLRLPVRRILDIMHRSELGKPLPDDFTFEFNPLWQMSDDLIVKDENAIQLIEDGLREVSCGYDAEYEQTEPGKAEQVDITGNHVALVPKGRAGNRCAIGDRDTMANQKKNWWNRMRAAIKTGDADTMNELVESAPASVTGDEGDLPQGVNLNINLSPQQPLPDKAPEMGGGPTGDSDDDLKTLLKALLAKLEGNATGDNDNKPDDNPTGDGEDDEEETTITGDSAWRAEVIVPGIDLSRKMKPTAFKREVLASADKTLVRQIVGDADIRKLPKQSVDMAFNAVSEIAKGRNTRATTGDAQRLNMGMTSIASLNKQNAEFWANRKG